MATPNLADPSDLALRAGLDADDPELLLALRQASAKFRRDVGHHVTLVTDDTYWASGNGTTALRLPAAPIVGTPTVKINGTTITDFETGRRAGLLRRASRWPDGLDNIEITYSHGYTEVPEDIASAVLEAAEVALNIQAGIESIGTGNESVKVANSLVNGGVTENWTNTVAKYELGRGDRS